MSQKKKSRVVIKNRPVTKKKMAVKVLPKPTTGLFLVVPTYDRKDDVFATESGVVLGPFSEKEAVETMDAKVQDGCERSKITVISGRRVSVQVKLA